MKTTTKVTEITHDELVNLLSTATCGRSWIGFDYKIKDYETLPNTSEDDCFEDKLAKILLSGKPIYALDFYADGEVFGKDLPHKIVGEYVKYTLTLDAIKEGVARVLDGCDNDVKKYVNDWVDEDGCNLDYTEADAIMQWILFGVVVYG
jgi:hypothetical protein